jgi:prepilin-type N-terminal cleavage/methylation domain-containing protein
MDRIKKFKRGPTSLKSCMQFSRGRTSKKLGFTLIEVMGAIVVLSIGVLVAYAAVQRMIIQTNSAASRLTAAYSAQEGIEIVRNIRDTNWVTGNVWNTGLNDGIYQVNYNNYSLAGYTGGFAGYSTGVNSKFQRKITLTGQADGSIRITVEIMWQEQGSAKALTVESYLYNWK